MKKISVLLLTVFFSVSMVNCEMTDVLDQEPPDNLIPENVVTNSVDAEALLNGVYSTIISFTSSSYYMYTELIPGALSDAMSEIGFGSANGQFEINDVTAENNQVEGLWQMFYKVIGGANNTIALVGELPKSEFEGNRKAEILGEAHFLRAMATFDALRYFGQFYDLSSPLGVIVRTAPVNFVTRDIERSSVQATYNQILLDLNFAIANAPEFTVTYRASKTSAKALKARVLLFMGRYEEAAQIATEVIESGSRTLAPDFESVFSEGLESEEMIFMTFREEGSDDEDNNRKQYYRAEPGTTWLPEIMEGDPRVEFTYVGDEVIKTNNADIFRPTFFIRLAEMYLIKAEALARSGASLEEIQEPLNAIKLRAGIEPSDATTVEEVLDEIFKEWVRELVFENGSVWFATIRFGKIMELNPDVTSSDQFILPLPLSELDANGALDFSDQNPGYL